MKTATRLFISSMIFGVVIAVAYWAATYETVGVTLLSAMAVALVIIAIYIKVAESEANLGADRPDADVRAEAGEKLGVFSLESYWPILAAIGAVACIGALTFFPGISALLFIAGALVLFGALRMLAREST